MFGKTRVEMVVSVDNFEAGKKFRLPKDLADKFIVRGYALGKLSREFSEDELAALASNSQTILV